MIKNDFQEYQLAISKINVFWEEKRKFCQQTLFEQGKSTGFTKISIRSFIKNLREKSECRSRHLKSFVQSKMAAVQNFRPRPLTQSLKILYKWPHSKLRVFFKTRFKYYVEILQNTIIFWNKLFLLQMYL